MRRFEGGPWESQNRRHGSARSACLSLTLKPACWLCFPPLLIVHRHLQHFAYKSESSLANLFLLLSYLSEWYSFPTGAQAKNTGVLLSKLEPVKLTCSQLLFLIFHIQSIAMTWHFYLPRLFQVDLLSTSCYFSIPGTDARSHHHSLQSGSLRQLPNGTLCPQSRSFPSTLHAATRDLRKRSYELRLSPNESRRQCFTAPGRKMRDLPKARRALSTSLGTPSPPALGSLHPSHFLPGWTLIYLTYLP